MPERSPTEAACTDGLGAAVAMLLPALEEFLAFEGPDLAAQRSRWLERLSERLPETGHGAEAVLTCLREVVVPHGLRVGSPGFCGWVTTMPTAVPVAAHLAGMVAASQRWWATPGNFLEQQALTWLAQLLSMPGHSGCFTSGGAVANLLGLSAARQHACERLGIDAAADGIAALAEPRVYASSNVHNVVRRALGVLGLGRASLHSIPTAPGNTLDLVALARMLKDDRAFGRTTVAVALSAGDVNTGAVDPIDAIRELAHAHNVWVHVDGAYGGFGVLDPRVRTLYGDLTQVDSFAVDPHKWLAAPIGCGAVLVRDVALLERANALGVSHYMPYQRRGAEDLGSPFDELGVGSPERGLEHSGPSRGLTVWAILKEIGIAGVRDRVARHLDCARRVADRVRDEPALELLAEPVLSICCFRYHPPDVRDTATLERWNAAIVRAVRARGLSIPSSTRVNNKLAIRPCFIGPRSTVSDADTLVDEVLAVAPNVSPLK